MPSKNPSSEFRILSLSGGGYLGLYAAVVLAHLEERIGEPLGRRFDLIAGTSVGGLLALALAYEVPMAQIVKLFVEKGEDIFSARRLPGGTVTRLIDLTRSVLGPKYTGETLRGELTRHLGARTLGDALHAVVIPAVDVSRSATKVFKTPHADASLGDEDISAVDVAMATSAAPAFFPSVQIGKTLYADGGLFAVAATMGYRPAEHLEADAGAVGWLTDGRLILTMIAVQQQHVVATMEDRLQDRYLRLDARWPAQAGLGIDIATRAAALTLTALGRETIAQLDPQRLKQFL